MKAFLVITAMSVTLVPLLY